MKNIIYIFLLCVSFTLSATVYYVQPVSENENASDANAGTNIALPWATLTHAFTVSLSAGDSVYMRGGIYYEANEIECTETGTYSNWIRYISYPGEWPVLDCVNFTNTSDGSALVLRNATCVEVNGLEVRNKKELVYDHYIAAVAAYTVGSIRFERIVSHDNGGHGFQFGDYDTIWAINCDSYNNADSISSEPGNRADGFAMGSGGTYADTFKVNYIIGCRAWHNSDDGIDIGATTQIYCSNSWAFLNGYLPYGGGNGFKMGWSRLHRPETRVIHHTLSAFNAFPGYADLNLTDELLGPTGLYYNNTSYKNTWGFDSSPNDWDPINGTASVIYKNNLVYASTNESLGQAYLGACEAFPWYTEGSSNNTWEFDANHPWFVMNTDFTVTDADFVEVDSTTAIAQLKAVRNADGSLPTLTFLTLAEGSDLINAGIDVGLPYNGAAPDIGYYEYGAATPDPPTTERRAGVSSSGRVMVINGHLAVLGEDTTATPPTPSGAAIVADHTVVDLYDDIPQRWIDSVKTKLAYIPGLSHGYGYLRGAQLLALWEPTYAVDIWIDESAALSDTALRLGRPTGGREQWWTNDGYIAEICSANITNQYATGNPYDFLWFGWSYQGTWENALGGDVDPVYDVQWAGSTLGGIDGNQRWGLDSGDTALVHNRVSMENYFAAVNYYNTYFTTQGWDTKFFASNGIVDDNSGTELGFQRELKNQFIRDWIDTVSTEIYFLDYCDILVWSGDSLHTVVWDDGGTPRAHQQIHPDNQMDYDASWNIISGGTDAVEDHIGEVGAVRLAKAMWWLLARACGWDGETQ